MSTKIFLESTVETNEKGTDSFLIRIIGNSLKRMNSDGRGKVDDLEKILSICVIRLSIEDIQSWIEGFRNSGESCSMKNFSDQEGNVYKLIIERISGKPGIFIFGAGHVGQALALMSTLLGYEVTVVDDRMEFASRTRLPDPRIKLVVDDFDKAIKNLNIGARSAAVIVTRGHQFDEICLENLLRLQISYLGMIGSKRRVLSIFKRLSQQGFADSDLGRVRAPIGLPIGARSPQEIAIAILAEIIAEANRANLNK
jgi:xanthine/CO dehydrogenase XdhC/CoxF family maturation factor